MNQSRGSPETISQGIRLTSRAAAVQAISAARKIATPEGVERLEQVNVGDDLQWISIRGRNRENPVLLVIHGGPGTPTMPLAWASQHPWEDYFTVVNWDQRGVGKNAPAADQARLITTISIERMVADGLAVAAHLCRLLGKRKLALLGFSWGSILGVLMAQRQPEMFSVLANTGQAVSTTFEEMIRERVLTCAQQAGDAQSIAEIMALNLTPGPDGRFPIEQVVALRTYVRRYNGMWYGHDSLKVMNDLAMLAPEYSNEEVEHFLAGSSWIAKSPLIDELGTLDLRQVRELAVPLVVLQGRHDLATPYTAASNWLEGVKAPHKKLVTFERSAHFPMHEEPGRFLMALITEVLPLTEGAAVIAEPLAR